MAYPEYFIAPMREELTRHGFEEARTAADVDRLASAESGSVLFVVNSVCGCAAGKARPGIVESLKNAVKPDKAATVFAGGDEEATARLRELLAEYPPSSPAAAIFKGGKPVYFMPRSAIESADAATIAERLKQAYQEHCG